MKPKLRHFLWKYMHDWFPTNCVKRKRGVRCKEICRRYGLKLESREHLFFHCEESKPIWKLALIKWEREQHLRGNFETWWKAINERQKKRGPDLESKKCLAIPRVEV